MIVQTSAFGSRATAQERVVDIDAGTHTLRELIGVLVRQELDAYERRRSATDLLRVLSPADLAEGAASGVYGREPRTTPPPPSCDDAVARAVEAFGDELFLVFFDGCQVEELDVSLTITDASVLRLIRLVALTGA